MLLKYLSLSKTPLFLSFCIAGITAVVFSPILLHDFINFDDPVFVYDNPFIQQGITLEVIRWAFTSSHEANWIPLTWLSHALDIQLFGLNPGGHHLVSLLLHSASSALLYVFLFRVTGNLWPSLVVSLLFALHPLHVESVAWVSERKDTLSTFFFMLTLIAYHRYTERPQPGRYALTLLLFACGLLAKSMLVTMPVVLLLIDYWPLKRVASGKADFVRLCLEKLPFIALAIGSGVTTFLLHRQFGAVSDGYTLFARLGRSAIAYLEYLYKMIYPVDLALIYPFSKYPPAYSSICLSFLALILISVAVVWRRDSNPYLLVGWFWFVVTLLPVIGIIQIGQHFIADRYTYIPLVGIFVAGAWGVPKVLERWRWRAALLTVMTISVVVIMAALTTRQLRYWQDSFTLLSRTVEVTEGNWVALNNLGLVHLQKWKYDEAIRCFQASIKAKPSYGLAYLNMGAAYRAQGEYDKALEAFSWVIQFDRMNPEAHMGLALTSLESGRYEQALAEYRILEQMGHPAAKALFDEIEKAKKTRK